MDGRAPLWRTVTGPRWSAAGRRTSASCVPRTPGWPSSCIRTPPVSASVSPPAARPRTFPVAVRADRGPQLRHRSVPPDAPGLHPDRGRRCAGRGRADRRPVAPRSGRAGHGADDRRGRPLKILGHGGYSAELMDRFDAVPLSSDIPGANVLARGVPDFFASFAELRHAYPTTVHEDGMAAWAVLPLIASGRPIGSPPPRLLQTAARLPARRTGRAHLTGRPGRAGPGPCPSLRRQTPPRTPPAVRPAPAHPPHVPGLRVAARYLPAARGPGDRR